MRRRDYILISVYIIAAIAGMFFALGRSDSSEACVYVSGQLYGVYDLHENADIHIESDDGMVNDIKIGDGSACMADANCPYRECVKSGKISKNGETVCCLPAKIIIVVRSGKGVDYDAVTK